jgi:two-component system sensor histidine kinase/response regulator
LLGYLDRYFWPAADVADAGTAYPVRYDGWLVLISVLVAVLASFCALGISGRVTASTSRLARCAWIAAGASSMGLGIWGMHFIGMTAFSLPCHISYDPWITVFSMLPGMLASGVALSLISRRDTVSCLDLLLGSVLMGGGIGVMHYSGMAAVHLPALLRYDTTMVAVSIIVAVAFAFLSLSMRCTRFLQKELKWYSTTASAVIMGVAISGMHYTAMDAALFFPAKELSTPITFVDPKALALLVTLLAVFVAAIVLSAVIAGKHFETAQALKEEITLRKRIEQDALRGQARLQAIFDGVVDAIVTAGRDGVIQQWSPAAGNIFGYTTAEAVGANLSMLMPNPDQSHHQGYILRYLATDENRVIGGGREVVGKRKDGSLFPVELSISKVVAGDEILFTGIVRDISERKRSEMALIQAQRKADEANDAKSLFLANMSHEVRTPINAIIGLTHLVSGTDLGPRQRDYIRKIQQSSRNLIGVVNDILDFSKIEAGQMLIEKTDFDVEDLLLSVSDVISEKAHGKGLELVFDIAADARTQVVGDPLRLGQILINLGNNAVKFTERGEIDVIVRKTGDRAEAVELTFSVKDTGIGMSPSQQERLFQSFQQADVTITRRFGGTGLGLAISKHLVDLMGGRLWVHSGEGSGSTFSLAVWLEKGEARLQRHLPVANLRGRHVLVADDNATARAVIVDILQSMSFDVDAVTDGFAALSAVRTARDQGRPYHLMFIDWRMPGMDGLETIRRLRQLLHDSSTPASFILITAYGREEVLHPAENAGLDGILLKPVNPSMLFDAAMRGLGADTAESNDKPDSADPGIGQLRGLRVLLVEDNALNQEVAREILLSAGVAVDVVEDGAAAVARLALQPCDLVLMDLQMPVMDGLEATRAIRRNPEHQHLPILAMTANAMKSDRDACLAAGMNDHIAKPIDPNGLLTMLATWQKRLVGRRDTPPAAAPTSIRQPNAFDREDEFHRAALVPPQKAGQSVAVGAPTTADRTRLGHILTLLAEDDPKARNLWLDHAPQYRTMMAEDSYAAIDKAIDNFDFDQAGTELSGVMRKMPDHAGGALP